MRGLMKSSIAYEVLARRGGRYPPWAHAGAVCASRRLRCDPHTGVAPRNSLRSLRSLCSNSRGESDERRALRAPTPALRFSPPQKSPPPGTTHRAVPVWLFDDKDHTGAGKAVGGCAPAATYAALRSTGLVAARASALRLRTRRDCLSGTNEVSAASFATGRETEHRKGVGAQRRPLHPSAGAHPPAALPRFPSARRVEHRLLSAP
jgi:hypothetical protein